MLLLYVLTLAVAVEGQSQFKLIVPSSRKKITLAPAGVIKGQFTSSEKARVQLLVPASIKKNVAISDEVLKKDFPRVMHDLFPDSFYLTNVRVKTKNVQGKENNQEYQYTIADQVDLIKFWDTIDFRRILARVYEPAALQATIELEGFVVQQRRINPDGRKDIEDLFSFQIALAPGENNFQLRITSDDAKTLYSDSVTFFFAPHASDFIAPSGLDRAKFHTQENEDRCSTCHNDLATDSCLGCHGAFQSFEKVHPPVEEEECLSCHDSDSDPKNLLIEDMREAPDLCLECHTDHDEALGTFDLVHPPFEESCLNCHDPHASNINAMLVQKVKDTCFRCHDDIIEGTHPVANHPLEGETDPLRPGKQFTCASCHNPHAADEDFLLRGPWFKLCSECHKK